MLTLTLSFGIVVSIILLGVTGLSAGGFITSGYVALVLDQPGTLFMLSLITVLTWGVVSLLSQVLFLYGPRRFGVAILVALVLSAALELMRPTFGPLGLEWRSVGYIVPGLIANQFDRQGFVPTAIMLLIAAPIVRVLAMVLIRW